MFNACKTVFPLSSRLRVVTSLNYFEEPKASLEQVGEDPHQSIELTIEELERVAYRLPHFIHRGWAEENDQSGWRGQTELSSDTSMHADVPARTVNFQHGPTGDWISLNFAELQSFFEIMHRLPDALRSLSQIRENTTYISLEEKVVVMFDPDEDSTSLEPKICLVKTEFESGREGVYCLTPTEWQSLCLSLPYFVKTGENECRRVERMRRRSALMGIPTPRRFRQYYHGLSAEISAVLQVDSDREPADRIRISVQRNGVFGTVIAEEDSLRWFQVPSLHHNAFKINQTLIKLSEEINEHCSEWDLLHDRVTICKQKYQSTEECEISLTVDEWKVLTGHVPWILSTLDGISQKLLQIGGPCQYQVQLPQPEHRVLSERHAVVISAYHTGGQIFPCLGIRAYFIDGSGVFHPTKQGVTLNRNEASTLGFVSDAVTNHLTESSTKQLVIFDTNHSAIKKEATEMVKKFVANSIAGQRLYLAITHRGPFGDDVGGVDPSTGSLRPNACCAAPAPISFAAAAASGAAASTTSSEPGSESTKRQQQQQPPANILGDILDDLIAQ